MAILDVTLQDGNSAELAKKLCGREIPFLVVSGYSAESEGIDEIFKSAAWLEKPFTSAALESALRTLVGSASQRLKRNTNFSPRQVGTIEA